MFPRTVASKVGFSRLFQRVTWRLCWIVARKKDGTRREGLLGAFGPFMMVLLICAWAFLLVLGFAVIQWSLKTPIGIHGRQMGFGPHLYMSGETFFTLGFGDYTAANSTGRFISVLEAGVGFGFLAIVISYLPVLYQSFSRREVGISLLDARAGSPPNAAEMLRRHAEAGDIEALIPLLREMERWAGDVLESHLSYPVLTLYRSQHDRQSWLSSLVAVMDCCALINLGFRGSPTWQAALRWQAQLTFAMARHTLIDLALILEIPPANLAAERLAPGELTIIRSIIKEAGIDLNDGVDAERRLADLRAQYEPFASALAESLLLDLPPWHTEGEIFDNWETSAWEQHHQADTAFGEKRQKMNE